jgi:hypothetical protein
VWAELDKDRNSLPRLHIKFIELPTHAGPTFGGQYRSRSVADVLVPEGYLPKTPRTKKRGSGD